MREYFLQMVSRLSWTLQNFNFNVMYYVHRTVQPRAASQYFVPEQYCSECPCSYSEKVWFFSNKLIERQTFTSHHQRGLQKWTDIVWRFESSYLYSLCLCSFSKICIAFPRCLNYPNPNTKKPLYFKPAPYSWHVFLCRPENVF